MDGSAKDFLKVLKTSELKILDKKIKFLNILKKVKLESGKRKISI